MPPKRKLEDTSPENNKKAKFDEVGSEITWQELNRLGFDDILELVRSNNPRLISLRLDGRNIENKGAELLAEALKGNDHLLMLQLALNSLGNQGTSFLAQGLKMNDTLTTLILMRNEIGNIGASALAEALKINHALTNLDLGFNYIGDIGASALAGALKANYTINYLDLSSNPIKTTGAFALVEALKTNYTLTFLSIHDTRSTENEETSIEKSIEPLINNLLNRNKNLITKVVEKFASLKPDDKYVENYKPYLKLYQVCNQRVLDEEIIKKLVGKPAENPTNESTEYIKKLISSFHNNTDLYIAKHYFEYAGITDVEDFLRATFPKELVNIVLDYLLSKDSLWLSGTPPLEFLEEGVDSYYSSDITLSSSSSLILSGEN